MASLDRSSNPKILLDDEEDFRNAFAELASAPLPMRAAYATQLRGTLRDELAAQAARRARPWWQVWRRPVTAPADRGARSRALRPVGFALAGVAALMVLVLAGVTVTQLYPLGTGGQVASINVSAGEVHVARPVRVFVELGFDAFDHGRQRVNRCGCGRVISLPATRRPTPRSRSPTAARWRWAPACN